MTDATTTITATRTAHGPLERDRATSTAAAPVLDIGGDVGALVVLLDPGAAGTRAAPAGRRRRRARRPHRVWARHQGGGHVTAALFPSSPPGTYWVLDDHGDDVAAVTVTGGDAGDARPAGRLARRSRRNGVGEGLGPAGDALLGRGPPPHGERRAAAASSACPVTHMIAAAARWSSSARVGAEAGLVGRHQRLGRRQQDHAEQARRRRSTPNTAADAGHRARCARRRAPPPTSRTRAEQVGGVLELVQQPVVEGAGRRST